MKPSKKLLLPYVHKREEGAEFFGVSQKTILRWLKIYGIYEHGQYGRGKLNKSKATEIRKQHKNGVSIKELATKHEVTFSAISRVVHYVTYKESHSNKAIISVTYNP